jgi:Flp pilus assembly protein TadG
VPRLPIRAASGQTVVEVALVLPVLVLLVLVVVQVGLLVRTQVLVTHAAREAARAASVDDEPDAPRAAAVAGASLDLARLEVQTSGRAGPGSRVRVELRYQAPTDLPFVGVLVGDVTLTAHATMRVE